MFRLFIIVISLSLIASDANSRPSTLSRPKRPADPVSGFFSELGDLFLDVDRGLAVQTAPKVEHEDNLVAQMFRPSANYFDRIQKNYRNIQHRLGKIVGNTLGQRDAYSERELSTVGPPVVEENMNAETSTTSSPEGMTTTVFNPFAAADKERELATKGVSRGYIVRNEECSNVILDDPVLEQVRKEKCARIEAEERASNTLRKLMQDTKQVADELIPIGIKAVNGFSKVFTGRSGSSKTETPDTDLDDKSAQDSSLNEECLNVILEDPILERLRIERCARIAAEQARRSLQNLVQEPKRVTEVLFPIGSKAVNQFSSGLLGRLGDISNVGESRSLLIEEAVPDDGAVESVVVIDDECLNEISDDPIREQLRREKCARRMAEEQAKHDLRKLIEDSRRASEAIIPLGTKTIDDFSKTFMKREGDSAEGDLFSGSFQQFLKDHGEWMLNNPLLARWRQPSDENIDSREQTTETSEATTVTVIPDSTTEINIPSTEYHMPISKSGESLPEGPERSSFYKIVNDDGDVIEEERVDVVFKPQSHLTDEAEAADEETQEYEPRDTIILAFTADGVPLKLRMGPEIDNPLRFLHKVLKSAGVSLNIPVESYDDIEPVGKEVLKLGTGILTRTVYIDVSNNNELKSFLKTLMKSKSSGKTQF